MSKPFDATLKDAADVNKGGDVLVYNGLRFRQYRLLFGLEKGRFPEKGGEDKKRG